MPFKCTYLCLFLPENIFNGSRKYFLLYLLLLAQVGFFVFKTDPCLSFIPHQEAGESLSVHYQPVTKISSPLVTGSFTLSTLNFLQSSAIFCDHFCVLAVILLYDQ